MYSSDRYWPESLIVQLTRDQAALQQCFEFRTEDKGAVGVSVVERLDPRSVARQHQSGPLLVPERNGKHAVEVVDEVVAPTARRHGRSSRYPKAFGIGVHRPARDVAQLHKVVDLAVEHDMNGVRLIGHRLIAALEIDNAQPTHGEPHRAANKRTVPVRAAVNQRITHGAKGRPIVRSPLAKSENPGYSAHVRSLRPGAPMWTQVPASGLSHSLHGCLCS